MTFESQLCDILQRKFRIEWSLNNFILATILLDSAPLYQETYCFHDDFITLECNMYSCRNYYSYDIPTTAVHIILHLICLR